MLQTAGAAQGVPPVITLLICVLALVVAVVALFWVFRLSERHAAREVVIEVISGQLDEIRQDGKRNTELLHLLISGHVQARRD
ncbi:hypothetical protein ACH0C8_09385 [Acetobacter lovaniensis]|uniref:hypothetical protein n=1 Tax=Acetobacter lovaniensis TaxID=104100 RepID=UPI00376FD824